MFDIGRYILVDRVPVPEPDLHKWAEWFETFDRHVKLTWTEHHHISTVFLGLDHGYGRPGGPVLFETMVFENGGDSGDMNRYRTWEEAEAGHEELVRATIAREVAPGLSMLERLVVEHEKK